MRRGRERDRALRAGSAKLRERLLQHALPGCLVGALARQIAHDLLCCTLSAARLGDHAPAGVHARKRARQQGTATGAHQRILPDAFAFDGWRQSAV